MPSFSPQTSERSIHAILNAGKIDPLLLKSEKYKSLDWPSKLHQFIKDSVINEDQLVTLFAKTASLTRNFPDEDSLDRQALHALPKHYIYEHSLLPYAFEDGFLKVLIIDPVAVKLKNELKELSQADIIFELTSITHLEKLLLSNVMSQYLDSASMGVVNISVFDEIKSEEILEKKENKPPKVEFKKTSSMPSKNLREKWNLSDPDLVIDFCQQILNHAIAEKVSDIHIECFRDKAHVRMRQDGSMVIKDIYSDYLFRHYAAATTRFKILANCDISEKRLPQDGAITIKDKNGNEVDFRFNVMPTKNGERIVMRILAGDPALSLDKIGFDPEDYKKVIDAITAPQGMVLVTGPTGSGKTTTLYGALQYINRPDINILTAEDPVEYYLEGAGQVQANERIGLSFSAILRAFLRQDPEVILVGEIRDQETIDIAIKAALTGHLLLSTLHTNDAISTITRILNMGVPNFMISSALSLVIAQRLARKNCQLCLEDDDRITPEILKKAGFTGDVSHLRPKRGMGCAVCEGKGLKGRQGIYEVLRITPELEEAILRNEQAPALLEAARKNGFRTMQEIGREFVEKGIISIEEFQSTLNSDV